MNGVFNLVPDAHLQRRSIRRRLRTWSGVGVLVCAGALIAAAHRMHAAQQVSDLTATLRQREALCAQLDTERAAAQQRRAALVGRAYALTTLRREHPLPEQLLALTNLAPEGVLVTRIEGNASTPPEPGRVVNEPPTPVGAAEPREADLREGLKPSPSDLAAGTPPGGSQNLLIRLDGYAIDHQELMGLIRAMQRVPHWGRVNPVRVAQEPLLEANVLAFRVDCRAAEDRP